MDFKLGEQLYILRKTLEGIKPFRGEVISLDKEFEDKVMITLKDVEGVTVKSFSENFVRTKEELVIKVEEMTELIKIEIEELE